MGWYRSGLIEKCTQEGVLTDITHTGLKLVVFDFWFVYVVNWYDTYYVLIVSSHNLLLKLRSEHIIY